jgi:hypothetical protein
MMRYHTSVAFRRALEDRLTNQSIQTQMPLVRLRKLVAFDRLLARLIQAEPDCSASWANNLSSVWFINWLA